jgi:hypothetical protein
MQTASRTLVKSPPEVWEQLDHPGRMEGLMCALVGHSTQVRVYERVDQTKLAWKADGDQARIEVELAEKGWGTNVSVSAESGGEATMLEGWLDALLEELATPQKRPFEGMTEAPAGTVAEAASSATAPEPVQEGPPAQQTEAEQTEAEEPQAEEPQAEEPQAEEPQAEEPQTVPTPEPEPAPRKKRFFGLL